MSRKHNVRKTGGRSHYKDRLAARGSRSVEGAVDARLRAEEARSR